MYDITWYEQTLEMQKDLLNVLVYQKPVIISITCLVPELSLRYYCSVKQVKIRMSIIIPNELLKDNEY